MLPSLSAPNSPYLCDYEILPLAVETTINSSDKKNNIKDRQVWDSIEIVSISSYPHNAKAQETIL